MLESAQTFYSKTSESVQTFFNQNIGASQNIFQPMEQITDTEEPITVSCNVKTFKYTYSYPNPEKPGEIIHKECTSEPVNVCITISTTPDPENSNIVMLQQNQSFIGQRDEMDTEIRNNLQQDVISLANSESLEYLQYPPALTENEMYEDLSNRYIQTSCFEEIEEGSSVGEENDWTKALREAEEAPADDEWLEFLDSLMDTKDEPTLEDVAEEVEEWTNASEEMDLDSLQ